MLELPPLTATEWVERLRAGEVSSADCLRAGREWEALESQARLPLNAWVPESSRSEHDWKTISARRAAEMDQRRAAGQPVAPLGGLPLAVKDALCVAGHATTAASRMLQSYLPVEDAESVRRLVAAGAIVVGKTNLDEFSMGSSTENSCYGPTRNPWKRDHVAGGSSGGSAAAVAAGWVPLALGSDTGGSIRQPAAFCGVTGLKPTYGRVSRRGLIAFASSLDQVGPLARSAADCALAMNFLAGHDDGDSTSSREPVPDFTESLQLPLAGIKVGVCPGWFGKGLDPEIEASVRQAAAELQRLGAACVEVEMPHSQHAVATYYVIACCEASSNLSRYDGVRYTRRADAEDLESLYCRSRGQGFGAEVQRRILLGTFALSSGYYDAYYLQASRVRRLIRQDYDRVFSEVDVLLGPTTPTTAFVCEQHEQDPLAMYLADVYTVGANLAGIPAISIPCGFSQADLPIGLQLQGPAFSEPRLLQIAHQYQQVTDWHRRHPPAPEVAA